MALDSAPLNPARRTVIIHDLETVGRTVNRPLQERFDIGLSPPAGRHGRIQNPGPPCK
jgi:hypothetical protein